MNECLTHNGGCEHFCSNTEGSFNCSCRDGFILQNNAKGCDGTSTGLRRYEYGAVTVRVRGCDGTSMGLRRQYR